MRVDLGDVELEVAQAGEGGEPLLLVHGFTGAKEDFGDWMEPFADLGFHAVAPDLRGHGASDHPEDEAAYSLEIFADDLDALIVELGWERSTLVGHSMGGMVAQVLATRVPEDLRGLVLMDTSHGSVEGIDPELVEFAQGVARNQGIEAVADILAEMESPLDTPAHLRLLAEREGYAEFGDRKLRASSAAMYAAMVGELTAQEDRLNALRGLTVPTLVLVGDLDRPFLDDSERLRAAIPGARLVVVPGAGHSPQFEAPDVWWGAVSRFVQQVTRDRPVEMA